MKVSRLLVVIVRRLRTRTSALSGQNIKSKYRKSKWYSAFTNGDVNRSKKSGRATECFSFIGLIKAQKPDRAQKRRTIIYFPAWIAAGVSEYVGLVALVPIFSGYR